MTLIDWFRLIWIWFEIGFKFGLLRSQVVRWLWWRTASAGADSGRAWSWCWPAGQFCQSTWRFATRGTTDQAETTSWRLFDSRFVLLWFVEFCGAVVVGVGFSGGVIVGWVSVGLLWLIMVFSIYSTIRGHCACTGFSRNGCATKSVPSAILPIGIWRTDRRRHSRNILAFLFPNLGHPSIGLDDSWSSDYSSLKSIFHISNFRPSVALQQCSGRSQHQWLSSFHSTGVAIPEAFIKRFLNVRKIRIIAIEVRPDFNLKKKKKN